MSPQHFVCGAEAKISPCGMQAQGNHSAYVGTGMYVGKFPCLAINLINVLTRLVVTLKSVHELHSYKDGVAVDAENTCQIPGD